MEPHPGFLLHLGAGDSLSSTYYNLASLCSTQQAELGVDTAWTHLPMEYRQAEAQRTSEPKQMSLKPRGSLLPVSQPTESSFVHLLIYFLLWMWVVSELKEA